MQDSAKNVVTIFEAAMRPARMLMYISAVVPLNFTLLSKFKSAGNIVWKSLYTCITLYLISLIYIKRFELNEGAIYTTGDRVSTYMDFIGFGMLILAHFIVHIETSWKMHLPEKIFAHFELIRQSFKIKLHIDVPIKLIRHNCRCLYIFFIFFLILELILILLWKYKIGSVARLALSVYSEVIIKLKLLEFQIFVRVTTVLQNELQKVAKKLAKNLNLVHIDSKKQRDFYLGRINAISDLHAALWANVCLIIKYYACSLPILLLKIFLDMNLLSYWFYTIFETEHMHAPRIYCCAIMSIQFLDLVLVFCLCEACIKLDRKFLLICKSITAARNDFAFSSLLRRMCLQFLHEPIYFTAGGFVDINKRTLGKFMIFLFMYIVILIQFRISIYG